MHIQTTKQMQKKIKVVNTKTGKVHQMTQSGINSMKKHGLWKWLDILPDIQNIEFKIENQSEKLEQVDYDIDINIEKENELVEPINEIKQKRQYKKRK